MKNLYEGMRNWFGEWMNEALDQAHQAFVQGEVPVGAVVVYEDRVIARAHNSCLTLGDFTAHAEMLAIQKACRVLGTPYLDRCSLYVTLEPCSQCSGAISLSRLNYLVFGAYNPKAGGVEHGPRIFDHTPCRPNIIGGVLEQQCQIMLRNFFKDLRD